MKPLPVPLGDDIDELSRIVRNQRVVNVSRAIQATEALVSALRELPLPVQNTILALLVARLERGDANQ